MLWKLKRVVDHENAGLVLNPACCLARDEAMKKFRNLVVFL
jgi:hypothetical protein